MTPWAEDVALIRNAVARHGPALGEVISRHLLPDGQGGHAIPDHLQQAFTVAFADTLARAVALQSWARAILVGAAFVRVSEQPALLPSFWAILVEDLAPHIIAAREVAALAAVEPMGTA